MQSKPVNNSTILFCSVLAYSVQVDRWKGRQVDRCIGGQVDRWTGGHVVRWTHDQAIW